MASQLVDTDRVRRIILGAIGDCECLRDAREAGLPVIRARDYAIELCMPLAPRTVEKLTSLPWSTRVEFADLEQAALMGIVEAIDSYAPHVGTRVNTHLWFRIRKRVYEEIAANHWTIMRPPRAQMEAFMGGGMTEADRSRYLDDFIRPVIDPDVRSDVGEFRDYLGRAHAEGMR